MMDSVYVRQITEPDRTVKIDGATVHLVFAPEANREITDRVRRILKASYVRRTSR